MRSTHQHDSCPSSAASTSSSLSASVASEVQPISMTANDCFDGSALFSNAPSAAVTSTQYPALTASSLQTHSGQTRISAQPSVSPANGHHDEAVRAFMLQGHAAADCSTVPASAVTQHQQPQSAALQPSLRPELSLAESAVAEQQQTQHGTLKPSLRPELNPDESAGTSKEEIMTLEELEARIASLNQTLLQAPVHIGSRSPPTFAMRPSCKTPPSPQSRAYSPQYRAALPVRPSSAHNRSGHSQCRSHSPQDRAALSVRPSSAHCRGPPSPQYRAHSPQHRAAPLVRPSSAYRKPAPAVSQQGHSQAMSEAAQGSVHSRPTSPLSQSASACSESASAARPLSDYSKLVSAGLGAHSQQVQAAVSSLGQQRLLNCSTACSSPTRAQQADVAMLQRQSPSSSQLQSCLTKAAAMRKLRQQQGHWHGHDTVMPSMQEGNSRPSFRHHVEADHGDSHAELRIHSMQQSVLSQQGSKGSGRLLEGSVQQQTGYSRLVRPQPTSSGDDVDVDGDAQSLPERDESPAAERVSVYDAACSCQL